MKEMNLEFGKVSYDAPILTLHIMDNTKLTYVDVKNMTNIIEKLTGYKPYFLLVEMGRNVSITPQALLSAGRKKEQPYRKATAVVFNPGFEKTIRELFQDVQPDTMIPRQHFTNKEEAKAWLLKLEF